MWLRVAEHSTTWLAGLPSLYDAITHEAWPSL
jgi:hypothetical protein